MWKVGDGFVKVLFDLLDDRGLLLEEVSLDATHGEVEVGLGFVGVVPQGFLEIERGGLVKFGDCFDQALVVLFGWVVVRGGIGVG